MMSPTHRSSRRGRAALVVSAALLAGVVGSMGTVALLRMPVVLARSDRGPLVGKVQAYTEVVDNRPVTGTSLSVVEVVKRVGPAVVKIDTLSGGDSPFDSRFGDSGVQEGEGSGFIINGKEGLAVTNNHVVANAREIRVTLSDKRVFRASVVGTDPIGDVALIRIEGGGNLPELAFGDSDRLEIGQTTIAIGNPLGFENTVTVGVLSQVGRKLAGQRRARIPLEDLLQTDAAINPGNSGGPLLDADGNVIGMNTAIISEAQGLGFAVAANPIKKTVQDLLTRGRVVRPWVGVVMGDLNPGLAERLGVPVRRGVLMSEVRPGEPGDAAGLRPGDVVTEANGRPVDDTEQLRNSIKGMQPGVELVLKGYRGGAAQTWKVKIGTMPDSEKLGL